MKSQKTYSYSSLSSEENRADISESSRHEEIARRAYEIWEQEGRPDGCEHEHWLEAERQTQGVDSSGQRSTLGTPSTYDDQEA